MKYSPALSCDGSAAIARLEALAPLGRADLALLEQASQVPRSVPANREIVVEGEPVTQPSIILSGWACRVRHFADGRRQVLSLLLPGDLIGMCRQQRPVAATAILSATKVTMCAVPEPASRSPLAQAFAISAALEEAYFLRQIARLGRLSAYERLIDWLLETQERLMFAGLADAQRLPMPLTQEMIADVLGLTSVHVNRTLRALRLDGLVEQRSGVVMLKDRARLASLVEYRAPRVSG